MLVGVLGARALLFAVWNRVPFFGNSHIAPVVSLEQECYCLRSRTGPLIFGNSHIAPVRIPIMPPCGLFAYFISPRSIHVGHPWWRRRSRIARRPWKTWWPSASWLFSSSFCRSTDSWQCSTYRFDVALRRDGA